MGPGALCSRTGASSWSWRTEGRWRNRLWVERLVAPFGHQSAFLVADPDGQTDFISAYSTKHDQSFERGAMEFKNTVDTMLLGRRTYEMFSSYWPEASGEDAEFAKKLNSLKKVVVSSTLKDAPWGKWEPAEIIAGDVAGEVRRLKQSAGKDMVIWGSISLASALLKEGLIDEIQLRVVPAAIGRGRQLFEGEMELQHLDLLATESHDAGLVLPRYRPEI